MLKSQALTVKAAMLAACVGILLACATSAHASEGTYRAHRVGLGDATSAPSAMRMLKPHRHVTYAHGRQGYNCASGYFTDVSAYSWQGYAIGAQRWDAGALVDYWRTPDGGRVTFDGITFANHSRHAVLVAGWCER